MRGVGFTHKFTSKITYQICAKYSTNTGGALP